MNLKWRYGHLLNGTWIIIWMSVKLNFNQSPSPSRSMWWDKLKIKPVIFFPFYSALRLCPSQVDLSPSFCVRSPHSCERNLLTFMSPYLLGPPACRVFWRCGMSDEEEDSMKCSFCSETEALAVKMVFCFVFSHVLDPFNSCHLVISPLRAVILLGGPSVAPDITNTITPVPHSSTPSTPPSVSLTTFVFTES